MVLPGWLAALTVGGLARAQVVSAASSCRLRQGPDVGCWRRAHLQAWRRWLLVRRLGWVWARLHLCQAARCRSAAKKLQEPCLCRCCQLTNAAASWTLLLA